jgi:hypothetical protein
MHGSFGHLVCRHYIDGVVLRAIDNEEVYLSCVAAPARTPAVRLDALSAALDNAFAKASCLALRPEESTPAIENHVVALVDAKRQQDAIAALDQLRENCCLRTVANIDRMVR